MSLQPLTDAREVQATFNSLRRTVTRGCKRITRFIGWQGGGRHFPVHWNPRLAMWSVFDRTRNGKRFLCFFGFKDPTRIKHLTIVCEVNMPCRSFDRRTAGVFARDSAGRLYLAHTGKVGGGRPGVGKTSFVAALGGEQMEPVTWPDGKETEVFIIGRVDGDRVPEQIRDFVVQVKEFKDAAVRGDRNLRSRALNQLFKPEFEGPRKGYSIAGTIESRCDHGPVVNALRRLLRCRFDRVGRDQERDLFVLSPRGRTTHLFEAKTDTSSSSIYSAVGQLLIHGAATSPSPRKILVVPGKPKERTQKALTSLGIQVLSYSWKNGKPKFRNLERVLN